MGDVGQDECCDVMRMDDNSCCCCSSSCCCWKGERLVCWLELAAAVVGVVVVVVVGDMDSSISVVSLLIIHSHVHLCVFLNLVCLLFVWAGSTLWKEAKNCWKACRTASS